MVILFLLFILCGLTAHAATCGQLVINPTTGKLDCVGNVFPNTTCSGTYTGFTFDGSQACLCVVGTIEECWPSVIVVVKNYLLAEDDEFILTEADDKILLEH